MCNFETLTELITMIIGRFSGCTNRTINHNYQWHIPMKIQAYQTLCRISIYPWLGNRTRVNACLWCMCDFDAIKRTICCNKTKSIPVKFQWILQIKRYSALFLDLLFFGKIIYRTEIKQKFAFTVDTYMDCTALKFSNAIKPEMERGSFNCLNVVLDISSPFDLMI